MITVGFGSGSVWQGIDVALIGKDERPKVRGVGQSCQSLENAQRQRSIEIVLWSGGDREQSQKGGALHTPDQSKK